MTMSKLACEFSTRKKISTAVGLAVLLFAGGYAVGKYVFKDDEKETVTPENNTPIPQNTTRRNPGGQRPPSRTPCDFERLSNATGNIRHWFDRNRRENACARTTSDCLTLGLPRHYIAYHLNGKAIAIDGKLDDTAWTEVPWTEDFVDIRSEFYQPPRFDTKVKLRWDDDHLYIGAHVQDTDLWGTLTTQDGQLQQDNDFEIFLSADESLHFYKQIQVNVLGTIMDQLLKMSPHDTTTKWNNNDRQWSSDVRHAVHMEGTVNQPGDEDQFWSIEMAFPFSTLVSSTARTQDQPTVDEAWFIQFGRAEYIPNVINGSYDRPSSLPSDWWSWQQCEAINLHLQDRWGLVQFKKDMTDRAFNYRKWHLYKALFDTFDALRSYQAINGGFTDSVTDLDVSPYVMGGTCVDMPQIQLNGTKEFLITVRSKYAPGLTATICQDRYVTFT